MLLMHFLNKVCLVPISLDDFFIHPLLQVHFNAPMNPLELEVYHQIKNVIGVNPTFYEYLFMVDADTVVDTLSLNRLVSAYV